MKDLLTMRSDLTFGSVSGTVMESCSGVGNGSMIWLVKEYHWSVIFDPTVRQSQDKLPLVARPPALPSRMRERGRVQWKGQKRRCAG